MRHVPTLDFIHDALPETARHIDDLLEQVREADAAAAQRGRGDVRRRARPVQEAPPGRADDSTDPKKTEPVEPGSSSSTSRRDDLPRRRRPRPPTAAPARSATPGRWTRWRPGCWCSASAGPPGCSGHLLLTDKAYDATIRLGVATTTDDAEGEVMATQPAGELADGEIRTHSRGSRRDRAGPVGGLARSRSTGGAPTTGSGPARRWSSRRGAVRIDEIDVRSIDRRRRVRT